jgi:integrase
VKLARQRVVDFLEPELGHAHLRDLGADDVRRYRLSLEAGSLAPTTVRHILSDARCFLNWCVETGRLDRSPFPRRVMPRIQEAPPDRLGDDEAHAVAGVPGGHGFAVRLGLATGLRWGELCRVRAEDLAGTFLLVHHTKTAKLRRVPVAPALRHEISTRRGRLVPYAEASPGTFSRFVRLHSRVTRFHVHQLRHTFACRWLERGGSLAALQHILGHGSVVTTQRYARLSDDHVRREAESILGATAQGW